MTESDASSRPLSKVDLCCLIEHFKAELHGFERRITIKAGAMIAAAVIVLVAIQKLF
jgi:hypothetical protein